MVCVYGCGYIHKLCQYGCVWEEATDLLEHDEHGGEAVATPPRALVVMLQISVPPQRCGGQVVRVHGQGLSLGQTQHLHTYIQTYRNTSG